MRWITVGALALTAPLALGSGYFNLGAFWKLGIPRNPTLTLKNQANSSTSYTNGPVNVTIANDAQATYWCLSESQTTRPTWPPSASATCNGGGGSDYGWSTTLPATFTVTGSDGDQTVYLWVANSVGVNIGTVSATLYLDTVAPTTPTSLTTAQCLNSTSSTPSITWTASTDSESGIAYYQIAIGTTSGGTNTLAYTNEGNVTSKTVSGLSLTNGTLYYISVEAVDNAGNISTAATTSWTVDTTAPTAPGSISYSPSTSGLSSSPTISWGASTASYGCGISYYELAIGTSSGGTQTKGFTNVGDVTSYQFTGLSLTNDHDYYASAKAVDGAGNVSSVTDGGSWEAEVPPTPTLSLSDQTTGSTSYTGSTTVNVTIGNDSTATEWCLSETQTTAPSSGSATCTGGTGPDNGWYTTLPSTFTLTSTTGSQTVYLWVANSAGTVNTGTASATIDYDTTAPTAPTGLTMVACSNSLTAAPTVTWTASTDSAGIDYYQIAIGTTSGGTNVMGYTNEGSGTSATISGLSLTSGTTYYLSIEAVDNAGNVSTAATTSWTATTTPPSAPGAITYSSTISTTGNSPDIYWGASTASGTCGIAYYQVAIGTTSGGTNTVAFTSVGDVLTDAMYGLDLTLDTNYYASVEAVDNAGNVSSMTKGGSWEATVAGCTASPNSYTTAGSNAVTVPTGCITATVKVWGGGGGGGGSDYQADGYGTGGAGGGGGYSTATLTVTPGGSLTALVGGGGGLGQGYDGTGAGGAGGTEGGGAGGSETAADDSGGGGGGGRSALQQSGTDLVTAGGGGGGGGACGTTNTGGAGGGGGGVPGGTGGVGDLGGTAGTSASGSTGGAGGGDSDSDEGGGGGAGGYAGGNGGYGGYDYASGGNGGTGYAPDGTMVAATGSGAAESSDPDYVSGHGEGGSGGTHAGNGTAGQAGEVYIIWSTALAISSVSPAAGTVSTMPTSIAVTFNEAPDSTSSQKASNWSMTCTNGGAYTVSSATLSGSTVTVALTRTAIPSATSVCTLNASTAILSSSTTGYVPLLAGSTAGPWSYPSFPFVYNTVGTSTFSVPEFCASSITVKAWGGGGGGGCWNDSSGGNGAGGGFAESTISISSGESLTVLIGGGGSGGASASGSAAGGTYGGGNGEGSSCEGGGGGGRTTIQYPSGTDLVTAGGGGGGGGADDDGSGGAGGGGGGGTPGSGGSCGTVTADGGAASGVTGGNGASATGGGGGGGGGYSSGGSGGDGGSGAPDGRGCGGNGGDGYASGSSNTLTTASGKTAANNSDSNYAGNAGEGGAGSSSSITPTGTSGNPGLLVITSCE